MTTFFPSPARNPLLSLVVLCCLCCRFLLSVPSLARNIFVQICVIGYAELKVRGKKSSFRALRGTLLSLVVLCCLCCRFLLSIPSPARNPFVQIRVIRGKISSFRAMRGTLLLSFVVLVVVFFFSFRAPRGTICCRFILPFRPIRKLFHLSSYIIRITKI